MSKTSPLIIMTIGTAIIASASSSQIHQRADITDIVNRDAEASLNYATYENDFWLLDGSKHFAPEPAHIGFVSSDISDAAGAFSSGPVLTLTLDTATDIEYGVTFEFSRVTGDYSSSLKIEYKDATGALISSATYTPDDYNYLAEISATAANVKYIVITFYKTNTAYRHIKLLNVYVDGVMFDGNYIKSASVVEQINPVSVEAPLSELSFSLYSADSDFSIVDPQGIYAKLKNGQSVDAYETVDAERIFIGRFYLDKWESESEKLANFECVDALGMLDKEMSYGRTYSPATGWEAEMVMDCIMGYKYGSCNANEASKIEYSIDSSLANIPVSGWLPVQTRREALQQLAFSIGGYLTCSRNDVVEIKPMELSDDISSFDFALESSDIANSKIDLNRVVTGVKIISHTFEKVPYGGSDKEFFADNVVAGDYLFVPRSERIYDVSVDYLNSTATVDPSSIETSSNFTKFTVTGAGYLVLEKSTEWIHNTVEYNLTVPNLPPNTPENIIVIDNATLVNPDNVADVALRVLTYYQQQYKMSVKLFAEKTQVGDSAKLTTQSDKYFGGIVEKMELDLSGGFLQKTNLVGGILPINRGWYGVEYLFLGGGGAGGSRQAGGGGAGELVTGVCAIPNDGTVYAVTVGAGGVGSVDSNGGDGGDSVFNSRTAHGGGGGGKGSNSATAANDGNDGGNGGGGGGNNAGGADGAGGAGYNFAGGQGSNGSTNDGGGGGGGTEEAGYNGITSVGGDGTSSDITGASVVYGGGGGGIGNTISGAGGAGGGGAGNRSGAGASGTANLGGGGGASNASNAGGSGGKGVVILRMKTSDYSGIVTGSPTVTTDGDYTVIKFTSSGTYTS